MDEKLIKVRLPGTFKDNSWHTDIDVSSFDLVVFAGSPEWSGLGIGPPRQKATFRRRSDVPVFYMGLGSFEGIANYTFEMLDEKDRELLKKAKESLTEWPSVRWYRRSRSDFGFFSPQAQGFPNTFRDTEYFLIVFSSNVCNSRPSKSSLCS